MKRKITIAVAAVALTISVIGCSTTSDPVDPESGDVQGTWTTITTPDGRLCDLWWFRDDTGGGYRGYGYAGLDCEARPSTTTTWR